MIAFIFNSQLFALTTADSLSLALCIFALAGLVQWMVTPSGEAPPSPNDASGEETSPDGQPESPPWTNLLHLIHRMPIEFPGQYIMFHRQRDMQLVFLIPAGVDYSKIREKVETIPLQRKAAEFLQLPSCLTSGTTKTITRQPECLRVVAASDASLNEIVQALDMLRERLNLYVVEVDLNPIFGLGSQLELVFVKNTRESIREQIQSWVQSSIELCWHNDRLMILKAIGVITDVLTRWDIQAPPPDVYSSTPIVIKYDGFTVSLPAQADELYGDTWETELPQCFARACKLKHDDKVMALFLRGDLEDIDLANGLVTLCQRNEAASLRVIMPDGIPLADIACGDKDCTVWDFIATTGNYRGRRWWLDRTRLLEAIRTLVTGLLHWNNLAPPDEFWQTETPLFISEGICVSWPPQPADSHSPETIAKMRQWAELTTTSDAPTVAEATSQQAVTG
jgi:hypothetical protein